MKKKKKRFKIDIFSNNEICIPEVFWLLAGISLVLLALGTWLGKV